MKNYILPSAVVLMFALGNCTEVEYRDIEKEVLKHDTVTKFVDRVFQGIDTVEIPVVIEVPTPVRDQNDTVFITKTDTVWAQRIDSVWITKTVYLTDTVVVREVVYKDTLILWYARDRFSIDPAVMPIFNQFFADASAHGFTPQGGKVIVEIVHLKDRVLQAQSFEFNSQYVIRLNDTMTADERWLPLMRELARWQLGKEYSQNPTKLMFPFTNANTIRMSSTKAEKEKFWTELATSE